MVIQSYANFAIKKKKQFEKISKHKKVKILKLSQ